MDGFIQKYQPNVTGVLHGWDRLMIRGTVRALAVASGMMNFLGHVGVLLKHFGQYVEDRSERVKKACFQAAQQLQRPVQYVPSSQTRKEEIAAGMAAADKVTDGLICLLTCVEPCRSYSIRRDRDSKTLVLEPGVRKCLHIYHYWMDRDFGLMHARLQTWFPFTIQVCLNGRSWLARQMDRAGMDYRRQENCFVWLEDVAKAQRLMDRLLRWDWPAFLGAIARRIHPGLSDTLEGYRADYYWSAYETEWASDVMFESPGPLAAIYPSLARMGSTRLRGLRPWLSEDLALLRQISRAEYALEGFRNRHLVQALYPKTTADPAETRRRCARVSYRLRILRAHQIIKKVPRAHRYQLTAKGRRLVTAILQTQEVSLAQLAKLVA